MPSPRHYFWHILAALSLHHIAVFIAFRRGEEYEKQSVVDYIPLFWLDRWSAWSRAMDWGKTHAPGFQYILRALLRWIPWCIWEELSPDDALYLAAMHQSAAIVRASNTDSPNAHGIPPHHLNVFDGGLGDRLQRCRQKVADSPQPAPSIVWVSAV